MLMITPGYSVLTLTEKRFRMLMKQFETMSARNTPPYISCECYFTMDDEVGERLPGHPNVGLLLFGPNREYVRRGPLTCSLFRHRGVEAFFHQKIGMDVDVRVTIEPMDGGFRLMTQKREGFIGAGGHVMEFRFEADEGLDRSWFAPPRDEGFLARAVPAIPLVAPGMWRSGGGVEGPWSARLNLTEEINAFEFAPGVWMSYLDNPFPHSHQPFLVLDPERYAWKEGVPAAVGYESRPEYLAADLRSFGDAYVWRGRIERFEHSKTDQEEVRKVLAELCVERTTGLPPSDLALRPFAWTRYLDP